MKSSWVVITLLLTVTGLAKAVPPQNPEQVNAMIEELKSLHQHLQATKVLQITKRMHMHRLLFVV